MFSNKKNGDEERKIVRSNKRGGGQPNEPPLNDFQNTKVGDRTEQPVKNSPIIKIHNIQIGNLWTGNRPIQGTGTTNNKIRSFSLCKQIEKNKL